MDFGKLGGLIPAVVQDADSNEVLMVGFMNDEAWTITQRTGYVTFFSRTRNTLWTKGETSGNRLAVRQIFVDCDEDTVLIKAAREGDGTVCHTGARTCFYTEVPR
jgi:phosphoribosyl-AMP cyclohydrolase